MSYQTIVKDTRDKMEKALHHLQDLLRTIRTSRASSALVEGIRVDYYGTMTPVSQMASISTRGCGSIETMWVRRLRAVTARRANLVELPEPTSRYRWRSARARPAALS